MGRKKRQICVICKKRLAMKGTNVCSMCHNYGKGGYKGPGQAGHIPESAREDRERRLREMEKRAEQGKPLEGND